ncbi:MAG TPA: SOS response-associated peptidase [Cryptosporangiaceae bacterium]|nr:SOS response-associated peptidase [Cryptosporangiaceae bacterium]
MCGRYASTKSSHDLAVEFDAVDLTVDEPLRPAYNVAPTDRVRIVRRSRSADARVVEAVRWGLVPSWAKDLSVGARMINARDDSLADKPAFRKAFEKRRCLVPADGWYEWARRENAPGKQAFFVTPEDGSALAFAGLWEVWGGKDDKVLSCAVVTTDAVGELAAIHDRMPLVLSRSRWAAWLGEADADPETLLAPPPPSLLGGLEIRPVGAAVGNVANEGPELVERVPLEASAPVALDETLF